MAEALGAVQLTLGIDDTAFQIGLRRAQALAEQAGDRIIKGIAGNTGTIGGLNAKLAGLRSELENVQIGTRRFRELQTEISKTSVLLNKAQGGGSGGGILSALAGIGSGLAIGGFLKQSIDSAVELETITRKLSNTLGEQGAARALNVTRGLADTLGLSFTTLAGTFGSFTAAASAAGTPLKVQEELFAAVAQSAQALGLSNDELQGSLLALQQIASKGNVQMEELRGQLGERLPIAFSAAAKGLGVTQQELIKLVESGRLTADQFFPALTKGLNELTTASGGVTTAAQNFQKLGNAWKDLQTSIGQNILPEVIKQIETLKAFIEAGRDKQIADRLGFNTGMVGYIGVFKQEALDSVAVVKQVQQQLALTDKQATALFYDAQKANGIKNIGLAKPEEVEAVLTKYRELAKLFREKYPDRRADLEAVAAASAAALAADKARLNTVTKINDKIKELQAKRNQLDVDSSAFQDAGAQLADLQRKLKLAALEPLEVRIDNEKFERQLRELAKNPIEVQADTTLFEKQTQLALQASERRIALARQLASIEDEGQRAAVAGADAVLQSINEAKRQQLELQAQLVNQSAKGASTEEVRGTVARLAEAGDNIQLALINGGRALADQLKAAGDRLTDTLTGNFNILNQQGKEIVLAQAEANITRGVQTGLIDVTRIPSRNDAAGFIAFSQQSKAIADAFENNAVTQKAVAAAQSQLAASLNTATTGIQTSFNSLTDAIPSLVTALNTNANADRSITVTVNADTGQTYIQQATALQ